MSHLSKISISIFLHRFLITSKYEGFDDAKNNKTKEFEHCFCQYLQSNIADIRLILLDHVTYAFVKSLYSSHICRDLQEKTDLYTTSKGRYGAGDRSFSSTSSGK